MCCSRDTTDPCIPIARSNAHKHSYSSVVYVLCTFCQKRVCLNTRVKHAFVWTRVWNTRSDERVFQTLVHLNARVKDAFSWTRVLNTCLSELNTCVKHVFSKMKSINQNWFFFTRTRVIHTRVHVNTCVNNTCLHDSDEHHVTPAGEWRRWRTLPIRLVVCETLRFITTVVNRSMVHH